MGSANFAAVLWQTAGRSPGREALLSRDGATSYETLTGLAASVAEAVRAAGVGPGEPVALLLERGPEAAAAFFGVLAAGGVAINVNEALRPRQIEHIVTHAGCRTMLASTTLLERLPRPIDAPGLRFIEPASLPPAGSLTPVDRGDRDVAQIVYTSGSTGLPKGVALSHGNLAAALETVVAYLGLRAEDRIASLLPLSYTYGLNQLYCSVGVGATLVVERSPLAARMVTTLRELAVSVLACVPPLWLQLLQVPDFRSAPIESLRLMTNAGGHLPVPAVRTLVATQPQARLFLMYGMTETLRSTYLPPDELPHRPDSMGRAIPGAEILVLREDGSPCAPGEVGELVHRGPTVALGYWRDPEGTARVFRPDPSPGGDPRSTVVFSGDLVRRDQAGWLYFVGRRDHIVKTLGYRVSPDEVTDVLHQSGEVTEAVVVAEPDEQRGHRLVAFVVLTAEGQLERLQAFCRLELPRHMQPSRIEVRAALPRTAAGKYDVPALQAALREPSPEPPVRPPE